MQLAKLADVAPNYKEDIFDGEDLKTYNAYSLEGDDRIGDVDDVLIDERGRFRYFVIDTGTGVSDKKVLLPTGRAKIDYDSQRVYAIGLTKKQAENLPKYDDNLIVDYDYEERVRNVYRPAAIAGATQASYDASSYHYDKEPDLYDTTDESHGKFKLYEERLVTNKERHQSGAVAIGTRVETKTAEVSVPIEKERVVIEVTAPTDKQEVAVGDVDFNNKEVTRVEVYEESADIQKKTFVSEEVSFKKEVERDTVEAREEVRREELQVNTDGSPVVETRGSKR